MKMKCYLFHFTVVLQRNTSNNYYVNNLNFAFKLSFLTYILPLGFMQFGSRGVGSLLLKTMHHLVLGGN